MWRHLAEEHAGGAEHLQAVVGDDDVAGGRDVDPADEPDAVVAIGGDAMRQPARRAVKHEQRPRAVVGDDHIAVGCHRNARRLHQLRRRPLGDDVGRVFAIVARAQHADLQRAPVGDDDVAVGRHRHPGPAPLLQPRPAHMPPHPRPDAAHPRHRRRRQRADARVARVQHVQPLVARRVAPQRHRHRLDERAPGMRHDARARRQPAARVQRERAAADRALEHRHVQPVAALLRRRELHLVAAVAHVRHRRADVGAVRPAQPRRQRVAPRRPPHPVVVHCHDDDRRPQTHRQRRRQRRRAQRRQRRADADPAERVDGARERLARVVVIRLEAEERVLARLRQRRRHVELLVQVADPLRDVTHLHLVDSHEVTIEHGDQSSVSM